jgi:hypothetical protein
MGMMSDWCSLEAVNLYSTAFGLQLSERTRTSIALRGSGCKDVTCSRTKWVQLTLLPGLSLIMKTVGNLTSHTPVRSPVDHKLQRSIGQQLCPLSDSLTTQHMQVKPNAGATVTPLNHVPTALAGSQPQPGVHLG